MSNRVIFTTFFRMSFPHLDKPHAANPTDTPKYSVSMMFPKTGLCPLNNQPSSYANILAALDEVCMEKWTNPTTGTGLSFQEATAPGMGIAYPPAFKDGDSVFEKDAQGNPIPGQINPNSAGMVILSCKNAEPVGVVGANGVDINPASVYAGSWCRAQIEVSAYDGKQGRVVVVKLLNVQMCYDDEPIGNRTPTQAASDAFSGMNVADTNIQAGYGQSGAMAAVPGLPPQAAQASLPPQGAVPGLPPQGVPNYLNPVPPFVEAPTPPQAAVPGLPPQAAVPGLPPQTAVPGLPPQAAVPGLPPQAAQAPLPPPLPTIRMNPGEAGYAEMISAGWTDELLIQHGKAVMV